MAPFSVVFGVAALVLGLGCADPCVDDGLFQRACPVGQDGTAAEGTADGDGAEGAEASADGAEGAEASADGNGDGDGDASGDGDGDLPPSCSNGVQDGDETDLDCGGVCGDTCKDGDRCKVDDDCINSPCNEEVCKDPVCAPGDNNGCQACLQQECCDSIINCFDDPKCACWFECISHNNDFSPCQTACDVGNIGPITSCANSRCNTADACAVP